MDQEFSPRDHIIHSLQLWWVLAVCVFLGGVSGYFVERIKSPLYQAKAVINTFIDFQDIRNAQLSEYDEDMTINSVQAVMLSDDVITAVIEQAAVEGVFVDHPTFMKNMSIYRSHVDYSIFYRDPNPQIAMMFVNLWAEDGVKQFYKLQELGTVPLYVIVKITSLADLPQNPTYYHTNTFVLTGAILGFVLGLLFSSMKFKPKTNTFLQ